MLTLLIVLNTDTRFTSCLLCTVDEAHKVLLKKRTQFKSRKKLIKHNVDQTQNSSLISFCMSSTIDEILSHMFKFHIKGLPTNWPFFEHNKSTHNFDFILIDHLSWFSGTFIQKSANTQWFYDIKSATNSFCILYHFSCKSRYLIEMSFSFLMK